MTASFVRLAFSRHGLTVALYLAVATTIAALVVQSDRLLDAPARWLGQMLGDAPGETGITLHAWMPRIVAAAAAGYVLASLVARRRVGLRGLALFIAAIVVTCVLTLQSGGPLVLLLSGAILPVTPLLRRVGEEVRYMARISFLRAYKDTMDKNARRILLLRPFVLDDLSLRKRFSLLDALLPVRSFTTTLEDVVAGSAFRRAPLLALADPKQKRELTGAIREYATDVDWQDYIGREIAEAERIIFIVGQSRFTGWETDRIVEAGALAKTVFVLPPDREIAVGYFRENPAVAGLVGISEATEQTLRAKNVKTVFRSGAATVMVSGAGIRDIDYTLALDFSLATPAAPANAAVTPPGEA
ncbi:MAG: hypothetical protein AB7O76_00005 [Rhizobiaceae bacterium]